jgi:hypothetical protein
VHPHPATSYRRHLRVVTALTAALALVLTGCADDDPDPPTSAPTTDEAPSDPETLDDDPVTEPTADDEPEVDGAGTDDGDGAGTDDGDGAGTDAGDTGTGGAPPLDDEASTADRIVEEEGFGLTLVDVRVGSHDGFDRVVFEVEGDSTLGYNVTVDDEAIEHGSGREVDVAGDGVVTVSLRGMYLPPDRPAGVEAFDDERVDAPAGVRTVTELINRHIFEGHHLWFIGTTEAQVPIRVARFEDPQRLVIDLLHP